MTTYLVQGADPALRDREVRRLVDELVGAHDRTLALEDHTLAKRRAADDSSGDAEATGSGDAGVDGGASLESPAFGAVVTAVQSPPFMTEHRVVVVREIGNLTAEQGSWLAGWVADPVATTHLVLVAGGGRTPAALDKACKAHGTVVGPAAEDTVKVLAQALQHARVRLAPDAAARVVGHLGDDAGRVPELVEVLRSTFGDGTTLDLTQVEPYLGGEGTAGRFDLTNTIDRGDVAGALSVLHRQLSSTSAKDPKPLHPMQVMATLGSYYQRLLRLDDPTIVTKEQAADALGMKSAAGARFALDASRRLGTGGLREAIDLLAQAELDLRGASGLDERTVLEVLVARLAALSRRHAPAGRARR